MKTLLLAVVALVACGGRAAVTSCADDLTGAWRGDAGAWMILDDEATLEVYPLFDDLRDTSAAPRLMDVRRSPQALLGEVHRRYTRGAATCDAKAQVHVLACSDDALELELADPASPAAFAPCTWAGAVAPHHERWHRE